MSRMRRAVSSTNFSSPQWMKGPQEYIEWGTVKRIVKKQIAKAVSECKTQAANAKQLVGDLKSKRSPVGHDLRANGVDYYEDDDSVWDVDEDTDFESQDSEEDDDEDDLTVPLGVMPTDTSSEHADYDCRGSPSDPKDDVSSLGSDASSYASASSNGVQVGAVGYKRTLLPRPKIPDKPSTLRLRRPSNTRPTSQPPPPPIPSQPPPSTPSECSEEYEVPICHQVDSNLTNIYSEQSTYEQIGHLEQTYEEVREGKFKARYFPPKSMVQTNSMKEDMPKPPLLPRQHSSPMGSLPPPPRPKTHKPIKTSSPSPKLHRQESAYDSYSLSSLMNRPLPPVPVALEDVYADVNFEEKPQAHELSVYPWFHDVEREEVDAMLNEINEQGCFLVRVSRRGGPSKPYTLSLLHNSRVFHLNIRKRDDGMYALGSEKPKEKIFETVSDLIEYHRQEEILLTSRNQSAGSTRLTETHHV